MQPPNFNNNNTYFNETDYIFNDSFQATSQPTYYAGPIQQNQSFQGIVFISVKFFYKNRLLMC